MEHNYNNCFNGLILIIIVSPASFWDLLWVCFCLPASFHADNFVTSGRHSVPCLWWAVLHPYNCPWPSLQVTVTSLGNSLFFSALAFSETKVAFHPGLSAPTPQASWLPIPYWHPWVKNVFLSGWRGSVIFLALCELQGRGPWPLHVALSPAEGCFPWACSDPQLKTWREPSADLSARHSLPFSPFPYPFPLPPAALPPSYLTGRLYPRWPPGIVGFISSAQGTSRLLPGTCLPLWWCRLCPVEGGGRCTPFPACFLSRRITVLHWLVSNVIKLLFHIFDSFFCCFK